MDPTEDIATSPVPAFPPGYDPEWALKDPQYKPKPRYARPRKHKAPKDSRIYKAVTAVIALKAQGYGADAISETLGLTKQTIRQYVYTAHRRGWVNADTFHDPEDRLDIVMRSKAVENIGVVLEEQEEVTNKETGEVKKTGRLSNRAVDMTKEVAKGLGMLKTHTVEKNTTAPPIAMALRVQVEIPQLPAAGPLKALPEVRQGSTGGVPAFDAEIIGGE